MFSFLNLRKIDKELLSSFFWGGGGGHCKEVTFAHKKLLGRTVFLRSAERDYGVFLQQSYFLTISFFSTFIPMPMPIKLGIVPSIFLTTQFCFY